MKSRSPYAYMWLVYAFLYIPIIVVIVYSFNNARFSTNWNGFTMKWYYQLFKNQGLIDAAVNSLVVAVCSATMATTLGSLAALCIHRFKFAGRKLLAGSIYMLTISPDIVMGISLLIFFIAIKVQLGFTTLMIAHITLSMPFVTLTVLARLSEFNENVLEAARDLGASEAKSYLYVLLPMTLPAVAAGWLLSFTLSMDDVLISFFVTGPSYEVLPLKIYSMVRHGVKPDINALSAIMFCVTLVLVISAQLLARPVKRQRED